MINRTASIDRPIKDKEKGLTFTFHLFPFSFSIGYGFAFWIVGGAMLSLCSCRSTGETAAIDPFLEKSSKFRSTTDSSNPVSRRLQAASFAGTSSLKPVEAGPFPATDLPTTDHTRSDRSTASHALWNHGSELTAPIQQLAGQQPAAAVSSAVNSVEFSPAEPRLADTGGPNAQPLFANSSVQAARYASPDVLQGIPSNEPPADEYLFDGGDRDHPIHYDQFNRLGLDTEDTVAEYDDHTGKHHVKPSNRVAVYSPRFGAVRTISSPVTDYSFDRLASALESTKGAGLRTRVSTSQHAGRHGVGGIRVRSRASGLETEQIQAGMRHATVVAASETLHNAFEELTFISTGRLAQTDKAHLAYGIQAAAVWSRDQFPIALAKLGGAQEAYSSSTLAELVGQDDRHKTKGRLRIVKLADKKAAAVGEVITFTIRYDNLGDRELFDLRIIDNLSPRLEYVADSGTSDRAGRLDIEDNEEGSFVLKFIVNDPLPGHQGGVVTFKVKVR